MRILALLACLFLAACASPMKRYGPGSGYNYSPEIDACIKAGGSDCTTAAAAMLINGQVVQTGSDSEAQAWVTYHLVEPHLDEAELRSLTYMRVAMGADLGITAVGIACGVMAEANPLGLFVPVGQYLAYRHVKSVLHKSPRAYSYAYLGDPQAMPSAMAAVWNLSLLLRLGC